MLVIPRPFGVNNPKFPVKLLCWFLFTMDGGSSTPTTTRTAYSRFPRSQKLKATCDTCSASKIRCTKEKPICNRCGKLGYPCFYSPARRIGRPHPSRKALPQFKSGAAAEPLSSKHRPMNRARRDESIERESNGSFTETRISLEHDTREIPINELQGSESDFDNHDIILDFHGPATPLNGQMDCPQIDLYILNKESPGTICQNDVEERAKFNFDDLVFRANSIEGNGFCYQAISSDATSSSRVPSISSDSSSTSSTTNHSPRMANRYLPGVPACGEGSASNDSEYDCATVAMNILQHLNSMTSMRRLSGATDPVDEIDALITTVSMAIKRVSTILVCPCSQKTDGGLLAAAVCGTILEIYGLIFHNPTIEVCAETHQHGPNTKIRVLAELPKVANLVMQFTTRYSSSQGVEEYSADVLPELAASLKYRLKYMTNEATNWLAQV
jgi:hypothetical protein